jgi:hypothetical protein
MVIKEFTYKDLHNVDPGFLDRTRRVRQLRGRGTRYAGLRGSSIFFRTFSSEYPKNGIIYQQEIKLLDLPESLQLEGTSLRDKVRLAMNGDVAVRCTCPAFSFWGPAYILTQLDAGAPGKIKYAVGKDGRTNEVPEPRFPGVRNPALRGTVCKHLDLVFEVVGAHWNSVERDLRNQGYE